MVCSLQDGQNVGPPVLGCDLRRRVPYAAIASSLLYSKIEQALLQDVEALRTVCPVIRCQRITITITDVLPSTPGIQSREDLEVLVEENS